MVRMGMAHDAWVRDQDKRAKKAAINAKCGGEGEGGRGGEKQKEEEKEKQKEKEK